MGSAMRRTPGQQLGDDELLDAWRERFELPVEGWNFADLDGEIADEVPSWSYREVAREFLRDARHVLDMGTGGGEVLLSMADALPDDTVATEGWATNLPIASRALAPHGIDVVFYDAEADPTMPFARDRFDLVLNRHEAYDAAEVQRVLKEGGRFVTQQVDGRNLPEVQQLFGGASKHEDVTLANLSRQAQDAGLVIERSEEWIGELAFSSVGAMIRYFAMTPWEVPEDFSVDRYSATLLDLHRSRSDLTFTQRRFLLIARAS